VSCELSGNLTLRNTKLHFPRLADEIERMLKRELPESWDKELPVFTADLQRPGFARLFQPRTECDQKESSLGDGRIGTFDSIHQHRLNFEGVGDFLAGNRDGRNLHFGICERAMAANLERYEPCADLGPNKIRRCKGPRARCINPGRCAKRQSRLSFCWLPEARSPCSSRPMSNLLAKESRLASSGCPGGGSLKLRNKRISIASFHRWSECECRPRKARPSAGNGTWERTAKVSACTSSAPRLR